MKSTKAYTSLANGSASYEQLWEVITSVREGSGIEELRGLFHSDSPSVIASLAYIAYEAGSAMRPLRQQVASMLSDENPQVRSDAVICLTKCVTRDDRQILGGMMELIDDVHPFVHRSVLSFIAQQTYGNGKLTIAIEEAFNLCAKHAFQNILVAMRNHGDSPVMPQVIENFLKDIDPVVQRFGVALACRATLIVDANMLDMAAKCGDSSGRDYARIRRDLPVLTSATNARISEYSARRRRQS